MGKGSPALPPAHDIFLHVQGGGWQNCLPAVETFVSETALAVLSLEWAKASSTELSVVLAEDAFVRALNKTYRDQPKATNVLSFPALEGDPVEEAQQLEEGVGHAGKTERHRSRARRCDLPGS